VGISVDVGVRKDDVVVVVVVFVSRSRSVSCHFFNSHAFIATEIVILKMYAELHLLYGEICQIHYFAKVLSLLQCLA